MRTVDQVKQEWRSKGVTLKAWADLNGYKADDVRDVLRGKNRGGWGAGHAIAVRLGLKSGSIGIPPKSYPGLKHQGAQGA